MWQNIKNIYHLLQAWLASRYYGLPSKKLQVIGVTGTDGKTTTTSLIYHILSSAGKKTSMITTVFAKVGEKVFDTGLHTTTPHSFDIQKFLKKSVEAGDEYFVLETTSHALDQNRIYGVNFAVAVITNITHEHLDYHRTYENYVAAKSKLLLMAQDSFINRDDISYQSLAAILRNNNKVFQSYGLSETSDIHIDISKKINQYLPSFNKYNYLAAYVVCHTLGLSDDEIFSAMKSFKLPEGRVEVVYDKEITVVVDFAHTPNATYEVLKGIREQYKGRRLLHLFGSAGHRDISKRPLMGEASGEWADMTVITEDDPRFEDPKNIAHQIARGIEKKGFVEVSPEKWGEKKHQYTVIIDRSEAVKKLFSVAKKGDVLVLTGKGHEKSIARQNHEDPWSDREEALKNLEKLKL